jgi:hypothetical protein
LNDPVAVGFSNKNTNPDGLMMECEVVSQPKTKGKELNRQDAKAAKKKNRV